LSRHPFGKRRARVCGLDRPSHRSFAFLLHVSDNCAGLLKHYGGMRKTFCASASSMVSVIAIALSTSGHAETNNIPPNRLIDYPGFLTNAAKVQALRNERRVTEAQFIDMATDANTIVFDARSDDMYRRFHIKGARHLSFPEITETGLGKVFPSQTTRILIYCNNNFLNAPNTMASKAPAASLNIHSFNTLYNYGYTNVYELGPLIDVRKTRLEFEGTQLNRP
jgi:phage shock protein E